MALPGDLPGCAVIVPCQRATLARWHVRTAHIKIVPIPWPTSAHTRSPARCSGAAKGQVRTGGAPGARTLNPRIKSSAVQAGPGGF